MATKYDAKMRKLEESNSVPLFKVHACPTPGMHEVGGGDAVLSEIERCPADDCVCRVAFDEHMRATRNRGTLIVLDHDSARL